MQPQAAYGGSPSSTAVAQLTSWPHSDSIPPHAGYNQPSKYAVLAYALHVLERTHLPALAGARQAPPQHVAFDSREQPGSVAHAGHVFTGAVQDCSHSSVEGAVQHAAVPSRRLFALGGRSRDWQGFDCVALYDAAHDRWSQGPPLPWRDHAPHAVAIDHSLFCVGNTAAICRLDLAKPRAEWQWHKQQSTAYWSGLHFMGVAAAGCHLWLLGGRKLPNTVRCCSLLEHVALVSEDYDS